jgi:hypothetical protein
MSQQKIKAVVAEAPSNIAIVWRSGKQTRVDVSDYFELPGYGRLKKSDFFATVAVEEWGHGVEWSDGEMGIDADALYRLGKEQSGLAYPVTDFNEWMNRNGLSLSAAAKALGITRRTIVYYHGGHKPIPVYIKLACIGWETLQLQRAA